MSILINLKLLPKENFGLYVLKNNNNAKAIVNRFFHLLTLASNKSSSIKFGKLKPL